MIYLLLISIIIFAVTSAWAIQRVGKMKDKTISQHIAKSKLSQIVFGVNGAVASVLASVVLFFWILPRHGASFLSYIVFVVLMIFFFFAAVIPQIEETWRHKVHSIAAWGMCFIIPVVIVLTLFWHLNYVSAIIGLMALSAICVLLLLAMFRKDLHREFLILQSTYLSIFFVYLFVLSI